MSIFELKPDALHRRGPLKALTTLRLFATMIVVLSHSADVNGPFRRLGFAGYESVSFFFILSGFILAYNYDKDIREEKVSDRDFFRARFARIAPAFYIGLLIALPRFMKSWIEGKSPTFDFLFALTTTPVALQAWWPTAAATWNGPAWSISVELLFYLSFPTLIRYLPRAPSLIIASSIILASGIAVSRFVLESHYPQLDSWTDNLFAFFPLFHFPQFVLGIGIGYVYISGIRIKDKLHGAAFSILFVTIAFIFCYNPDLPSFAKNHVLLTILFGALIFCAAEIETKIPMLEYPLLLLLGESSYALYIYHQPIIQLSRYTKNPEFVNYASFKTALIFGIVLLSVGSFTYVEKPLRSRMMRRPVHSAR